MKKQDWSSALAGLVALAAFTIYILAGCAGIQVQGPNPFEPDPKCTIYQGMGIDPATSTGVIPEYIKNPCAAQNIVVAVARSGVALEAYQLEDVRKFVEEAKRYTTVGLTFQNLKLFVGAEVGKLNREFGLLFFTVSDLLIVLPDSDMLALDDVKLVHASLDDVLKKTEAMASLLK